MNVAVHLVGVLGRPGRGEDALVGVPGQYLGDEGALVGLSGEAGGEDSHFGEPGQ